MHNNTTCRSALHDCALTEAVDCSGVSWEVSGLSTRLSSEQWQFGSNCWPALCGSAEPT